MSNPYSEEWNIKEVQLNTSEGAWMNLDVSPDGKIIEPAGDVKNILE